MSVHQDISQPLNSKNEGMHPLGASFRDPSGFIYKQTGKVLRQVNKSYAKEYDLLISSGLYTKLVNNGWLIPHQEVEYRPLISELAYKIIQPIEIDFISYPFEWCFSQLKDAALLTLEIQKLAINFGMSLKDASAYNIQFHHGKPTFIDTLSFEKYQPTKPWDAYRQFCQHFLNPLILTAYLDIRLNHLSKHFIDGIPLDLTSRLLPWRSYLSSSILFHIHMHAKSQQKYATKEIITTKKNFKQISMLGLLDNLTTGLTKLQWKPSGLGWKNYYQEHSYSEQGMHEKIIIINRWLDLINPRSVIDLGANIGNFSRLASQRKISTVALDVDPAAVELNYLNTKSENDIFLLPLVMDITNPTPAIGWQNIERSSFFQRGSFDGIFALALIHHLAIANNITLKQISDCFSKLGKWLIIEFIPKEDQQVKRLLTNRVDIFPDYTYEGFQKIFSENFKFHQIETIPDSHRRIYLLENLRI